MIGFQLHLTLRLRIAWPRLCPAVLGVLTFFSGLSLCAQSVPQLPDLPTEGLAVPVREQIREALQIVTRNPNGAEENGRLGMLLYAYEQYKFAEPCFERARIFDPKDGRWSYYLGITQANLAKYDQAVVALHEALRLDPGYLPAKLKLGECFLQAGKSEESLKVYKAIVEKYPDDSSARYGMGKAYAARHEYAPAIENLRKACEIFPNFGAAHFALARAYRDSGDADRAREELELYQKDKLGWPPTPDPLLASVLDLKTDSVAQFRKGIDLAEAGHLQAAVEALEGALKADPKLVLAHIHLIAFYGKLGQPAMAEQHYRAAVALDPNLAEVHYNYGVLLMEQGRYSNAAEAFRRALGLNPSYAEAHNNYAYSLMVSGKLDEAKQQYRAAIECKPDYRPAHFNLGRILVQQGKVQDAINEFLQTIGTDDEETPRCLYALAAAYARANDPENALKYMRQAQQSASTYGQSELLNSIERDLRILARRTSPP